MQYFGMYFITYKDYNIFVNLALEQLLVVSFIPYM